MDPKIWGPSVWSSLIYIVAELPVINISPEQITALTNLINSLKELLPCPNCRLNFTEFLTQHSVPTQGRTELLKWLCLAYNHSKKSAVSLSFFINRHVNKTIAQKITPIVTKPVKAPIHLTVKAPINTSVKAPINTSVKAPIKASVKAPVKPPVRAVVKAPIKKPVKAPIRTPTKVSAKTSVQTVIKALSTTLLTVTEPVKEPEQVRTSDEIKLIQTFGIPTLS